MILIFFSFYDNTSFIIYSLIHNFLGNMSENSPKLTDITTNLSQTQPIPKYINSLFTSQIKSEN